MATRKPIVIVDGQLSELPAEDNLPLTWGFLVMSWSTPPAVVGTLTGALEGRVFSYALNGVTRFRFVPTPYTAQEDKFFSNWNSATSTLSGLIVSRG